MAQAFNLTAQLNLRGPSNIGNIVSDIKRQLGTITGDIKIQVDASSIRNATQLTSALQTLNNTLAITKTNATDAERAIKSFIGAMGAANKASASTSSALNSAATASNNLAKAQTNTAQKISGSSTQIEEFGRQSALAVKRFAAFSAVTTIIFSVTSALKSGLATFVQFDKELVKLQQVTGKNGQELGSLSSEITTLSTTLGVASTELIGVAGTLAQAGLSAKDTERALRALALTDLAPSFDSMNETVEGSIALMKQFQIGAGDLESALGSINAVSAAFAVEASDIITAIQRTGGVFASASKGVSEGSDALNEFIAVFTSVRATTRESAETIATGLRTIFTRIQRRDTIDALKEFGVVLTDSEGKFVGAYKAIQLLSEGLGSIDPRDLKFSEIVEQLGGFRQIGKVIPLIHEFATAQDALKIAQQGQGSLAKDAGIAQLSLANQMMKVREEFLSLVRTVGSSNTFQTLAKTALGFASALITVAGSLKGLLPILAILAVSKGMSAMVEFGSGFVGGLSKKSDKGSGEDDSSGRSSAVRNMGNRLSGLVTGNSGSSVDNSALTAAIDALSNNVSSLSSNIIASSAAMGTLTSGIDTLSNNIVSLTYGMTAINSYIIALESNTVSLSTNTASIDRLSSIIDNLQFPPGTGLNSGGFVRKFARGGVVPGQGNGDTVPAMLEPGEFVIRKKAVETLGASNLHKMNKSRGGSIQGYAGGGAVQKFVKAGEVKSQALESSSSGKLYDDIKPVKFAKTHKSNAGKLRASDGDSLVVEVDPSPALFNRRYTKSDGKKPVYEKVDDYNETSSRIEGIDAFETKLSQMERNTYYEEEGGPDATENRRKGKEAKQVTIEFISDMGEKEIIEAFTKTNKVDVFGRPMIKLDELKTELIRRKLAKSSGTGKGQDILQMDKLANRMKIMAEWDPIGFGNKNKKSWDKVIKDDYMKNYKFFKETNSYLDPKRNETKREGSHNTIDDFGFIQQMEKTHGKAELASGGKIQKFKDAGAVYPVDAIATYQNNSRDINTHLARPDDGNLGYGPPGQVSESDKAHIAGIKETIKKLDSSPKTKVPDNVYTGIGETRLDIIKQQIGNQLGSQKDVDSAAGSTFALPGFLSTSKAKKIGMNFSQRAFLDIKTKKDATGIDVNAALPEKMLAEPHKQRIQETQRGEQEVILPRSSSLKILKASANYNSANMSTPVPWTDPSYDVNHDPFYSMDIQQLGIGGVAKEKMANAKIPLRDMYRRLAKEGRLGGTGITDKDFVSRVPNKHDDLMNRLVIESFADEEAIAQKAIAGSEIFGLVGLIGKTKHMSLGPEIINGKSIYTKIGILSEKTSASLQKQMEGVNASSTKNMAESIQAQEFLGSGKNLAIDFDETLVSGADIFDDKGQPDIEKYFDMKAVAEALQNAKLKSPIGTHLKEILEGDPKFIEKIRVLSARPQTSADLIAATLTRLGIPIGADRVTGVSTPGMTGDDVAQAKAKNLGYDEALIDDNLQNILAARKANKTAHLLTPVTPMSQEDLAITGKAEMEGYTIQQILTQLGAKAATKGAMSIDFPSGLGPAAQFFGMEDSIPTDVKRTIDSTSIGKYRAEVLSFLENRDGVFGTKGSGGAAATKASVKNAVEASVGASVGAKNNTQKSEATAQRNIGYIDSDVLANPENSAVVGAEMSKLGMTKVSDYKMHLSNLAAAARSGGSLDRLSAIVGVAGSGKSSLMLGGSKSSEADNASLRQTTRSPILTPEDISSVSQIVDVTATVSPDRLSGHLTSADKVYSLSSSTKEEREEVKRRRGSRDVTGNNLFGRSPGATAGAPTDSGPMEGMLASEIDPKKLRTLGITSAGFSRKMGPTVETKPLAVVKGGFAPTTLGHESMLDAAKAMGFAEEDFVALVGSNEGITAKDPDAHDFRTVNFDQDFRTILAKAAFSKSIVNKADPGFGMPDIFEGKTGEDGRRHFVRPDYSSSVYMASGKTDKQLQQYKDKGYSIGEMKKRTTVEGRTEEISGTVAREAILSGDIPAMRKFLSPAVFDIVQKNLTQLQNRDKVLPEIMAGVKSRKDLSLASIDAELANFPARIDRKKMEDDPAYKIIGDQVDALRERKKKIQSHAGFEPFTLMRKLAEQDPEKYGLHLALGGKIPKLGKEVYDLQKTTGLSNFDFEHAKRYGDTMGYSIPEFKTYLAKVMEQKKSKAGMKIDSKALLESLKVPSSKTSTPAQLALAAKLKGPSDAAYTPRPSIAEDMASVNRITKGNEAVGAVSTSDSAWPIAKKMMDEGNHGHFVGGHRAATDFGGSGWKLRLDAKEDKDNIVIADWFKKNKDLFSEYKIAVNTDRPVWTAYTSRGSGPEIQKAAKKAESELGKFIRLNELYDTTDTLVPETGISARFEMRGDERSGTPRAIDIIDTINNKRKETMKNKLLFYEYRHQRGKGDTTRDGFANVGTGKNGVPGTRYYQWLRGQKHFTPSGDRIKNLDAAMDEEIKLIESVIKTKVPEYNFDSPQKLSNPGIGPPPPPPPKKLGPPLPPPPKRFAMGGATSDTVPALLTPGEFVINKKAAESIGYNKLEKMNHADKAQGFAKGGSVGNVQGFASGGYVQRFITGGTANADTLKAIEALGDAAGLTADEMKRSIQQSILERAHRIKADSATAINTNVKGEALLAATRLGTAQKAAAIAGGPEKEEAYQKDADDTRKKMTDTLTAAAGSKAEDPKVAANIADQVNKMMSAAENNTSMEDVFQTAGFKEMVESMTSDLAAYDKALQEMSAETGLAVDSLKTLGVSMEDIGIDRTMKQMSAAVQATSAKMIKYASLVAVLGDNLGSFISGGPEAGRGSKVAGAAISAGSSAGTAAFTAIRTGMDTAAKGLTVMSKMPGVMGSVAQKLLPQLANPYVLAGAIVVAAAVGIAAAFMAAHNAAKAFDKALQTKNLENALEKASEALNDFAKDNKDIGALNKARSQLGTAGDSAKQLINLDVQVPDAMWVNLFDALGSGQQASERSQILQKEGTLGYIQSTDMFGGEDYRQKKMKEYAPEQAKKNAATFSPVKEGIFKVFEAELRSGEKTVDEVFGELKNSSGGVSSFAESIARANPAVEEELLLLEQEKGLKSEEKNTIREGIIAREAEKRTVLSVNAVKRQMAIEDLDKAARTFGLNVDRMLKNMDGAINKTSFELDALSSSLSLSNDALSGNAKSGATSLDSINILKNQGAYSEKDNERARGQAGAFFGADSENMKGLLKVPDKLQDTVLSSINKTLKKSPSASDESLSANITMDLNKALKDLNLPPELADKLARETGVAFKDFKGKGGEDSTISYDELTESVGAFSKTISSAERAQEMANRALEFWQKNLNEYSESMNQAAGYQVESNSRMRKASDIKIRADNELNKTLGNSPSMNSQIKITQDSFKARTTGATSDPTAIGESVRRLNDTRDQQQKSSDSLVREKGQGGIEEYKMMRTRLNATNVALKENYDALKDMAENTDIASAALSRMSEIKEQRKSGENLIERLVTSDQEGIAKFNSSMLRLNNNMKGVANVGTTAEQRGQSLQDFNSIAPLLGNGKKQSELKANVLESQLSEAGIGVDPMMQQVLDSLRNPEDDPQMKAAQDAYNLGNSLQSEANAELAKISKIMADQTEETAATKLTSATTDVALSFNDKKLTDINDGIQELIVEVKRKKGADALSSGGMVYASEGRHINFQSKGTDTVPAMLTPGEFVVNRAATQQNLPLLKSINSGAGRYQKGGSVGYYDRGGLIATKAIIPTAGAPIPENYEELTGNVADRTKQVKETKVSFPKYKFMQDAASSVLADTSGKTLQIGDAQWVATGPTASPRVSIDSSSTVNPLIREMSNNPLALKTQDGVKATAGYGYDNVRVTNRGGFGDDTGYQDVGSGTKPSNQKYVGKILGMKSMTDLQNATIEEGKAGTEPLSEKNREKYLEYMQSILKWADLYDPHRKAPEIQDILKTQNETMDISLGQYKQSPANFNPLGILNTLGYNETVAVGLAAKTPGMQFATFQEDNRVQRSLSNTATPHNIGIVNTGAEILWNMDNQAETKKIVLANVKDDSINSQDKYFRDTDTVYKRIKDLKSADYKESGESIKIKQALTALDYFYDGKGPDEIQITEKNFAGINGDTFPPETFPISLIQQNSGKEKNWAQIQNILKKAYDDEPEDILDTSYYDNNKNNPIALVEHDTEGKFTANLQTYSWLSDRAKDLLGKAEGGKQFDQESGDVDKGKSLGIVGEQKIYGTAGVGKYNFGYKQMKAPTFNTQTLGFTKEATLTDYVVIEGLADTDNNSVNNPFAGYVGDPIVYRDISDVIKMLDNHTPTYNTGTKQESAPIGDPFKYSFWTHKMAEDKYIKEDPLTKGLLEAHPELQQTIIGSDIAPQWKPVAKTFYGQKYEQNRAERIKKADLSASIANYQQVDQTIKGREQDPTLAFTEAKRVTIARAIYDHGVRNNQLAGGTNIQSVGDIGSAISPLLADLTSITDKKSEAYLRKDGYRAVLRDLLVGKDDLNRALQYFNALGLSTDNQAFRNPVTMKDPGMMGRDINKYFSNWTGNDDAKLETLISREIITKTLNTTNRELSDQDTQSITQMTMETGPNAGNEVDVLDGGVFYKITRDADGSFIKTIDDKPEIKTYNDVFNKAYNPENMFSGGPQKRQQLMDVFSYYVNNAIDPNTKAPLFQDQEFKDNLLEASPLRQYYKVRDTFVDPERATEDLVSDQEAKIQALKTEDSELSDPADERNTHNMIDMLNNGLADAEKLNHKLTGETMGKLWDKEKILAAMTALLPKNQEAAKIKMYNSKGPDDPNAPKVEEFNRGGMVYASKGQHINFEPKGTDTVPAMLTPGEFVVNRQSTQQNLPVLKAINSGTYSHGDIVRNLSRGGLSVPRYYLNGTNNGVPATGQGPSQGSSQAFDFTSFMNTFKDMLKTGLDTLKSLSPQPSGVSDSSQGSVSSIDNFVSRLDKIATTLASLNIPPEIKITGTHDVNVIINGDTVLNQLKPDLADIVASSIKKAFQDFKALNPSSSETMNFDI